MQRQLAVLVGTTSVSTSARKRLQFENDVCVERVVYHSFSHAGNGELCEQHVHADRKLWFTATEANRMRISEKCDTY